MSRNGRSVILTVEDETLLLMVVAETLRDAGYEVCEAGDGQSALAVLKGTPDIDLVLSDVRMPGMNGYDLADACLKLRPELKILMMTGYAQGPIPPRFTHAGIGVLYKPFDFDKLPSFVGSALKGEAIGE